MVKRQCVAPTKNGDRCRNMVVSPKVCCPTHRDMYQTDEPHGGECDCTVCELVRSQPVGMVEFSGMDLLDALTKEEI